MNECTCGDQFPDSSGLELHAARKHPRGTVSTFTAPGLDEPRAYIVATFARWGTNWSWEIQYSLTDEPWHLQHIILNSFNYPVQDTILDLRKETY